MKNLSVTDDFSLKNLARSNERSRYDWSKAVPESSDDSFEINLVIKDKKHPLQPAQIADIIGQALGRLLQVRGESTLDSPENLSFVSSITAALLEKLQQNTSGKAPITLTETSLHLMLEKTLVEKGAHDVARSLLLSRPVSEPSASVATKVIRRNGHVVPWNADKIEIAVRKAFLSLEMDSESAVDVAEAVSVRAKNAGQSLVHIETLQDWVQEELMRQNHYKVAEHYILYRNQHNALRQAEQPQAQDDAQDQASLIVVKKDDDTTYFWDGADLKKRIRFATMGLDLVMDENEIETALRRSLFNEISERDLKHTIILNAKTLIEEDADFALFAGRLRLTYIYEETLGWDIVNDGIAGLKALHAKAFRPYLERAVEIERLNPKLLEKYDIDALAEALDPSADFEFDFLGIQTLYDRYLIVDKERKEHRRLECPQFFWMRVAMGLFLNETKQPEQRVKELYRLYKDRLFCSSTPTLFNSGTLRSQLSSCYLYKVDDSIESIMTRGIAENAYLSKWAGGLGGSWTQVRCTGSRIKGTNGESQGVVPFLKMHNDQLVAVNQGGKRRGSGCAYLESWHGDIEDFMELRRNTGDERRRTHDMNTANWIPDLFMKRMEARQEWSLFRSNEAADLHDLYGQAFEKRYEEYEAMAAEGKIWSKKLPAIELWKKMLSMLFETGHPWITFKDPCNIRSPQDHVGVIHSSNLCTEITLNTSDSETAVCNLGSVVLPNHLTADGQIDHDKLRRTIRTAIRALDNVIDINFYPTDAARNANSRHRPIGMGLMGLQDALYEKNISFASDDAVAFNDEMMEAIAYYAYEASSDLAAEFGPYSTYKGSKWDRGLLPQDTLKLLEQERGMSVEVTHGGKLDWDALRTKIQKQGMRNSNVLAIAPTATISNIMGTMPCIEPTYKNLYVKSNLSGEFLELNVDLVRDLKKLGLWDKKMRDNLKYFDGELADIDEIPTELKEKYRTAFGIPFEYFIKAAAARQKWIDQSQSVNLFLASPDMKTLSHMYRAAWRAGLKTTYYLRTLGASNIEKATVSVKKEIRGLMGQKDGEKKEYTPEEKLACSIEAMRNGGECEACQ